MTEERRQNTLDVLLIEFGELKSIASNTHEKVSDLNTKVSIQNGRISSLEKRDSFIKGCIAVLTVLVLPITFFIIAQVVKQVKF